MSWPGWLYPVRTGLTVFDYWFLAHFTFWFFAGSSIAAVVDNSKSWLRYVFPLISSIFAAVLWEYFERMAEVTWPDIWQSPESTENVVVDVLICPIALLISWWGYAKWRPR